MNTKCPTGSVNPDAPNIKTVRGPFVLTIDGIEFATEATFIAVDDWRETPWGPMNVGWPSRFVRVIKSS